jgi:hypothetical protein
MHARLRRVERLVDAYLEQARSMTYAELRERQVRPFASLQHGAAGLAYVCWRAATVRRDPSWLDDAERWSRFAEKAPDDDFLFEGEAAPSVERSILGGRDGALVARILVAHARGRRDERATRAFRASCRDLARAPSEVYLGAAGYLAAARTLLASTGDERFRAAADDVAAELVRRAPSWGPMAPLGFAHGRAGILHALVRWDATCEPTPRTRGLHAEVRARLPAWLEELAGAARGAPRQTPWEKRSLCRGAGGMAILWAAAHARERDARYLARARASARLLLSGLHIGNTTVCCGHAGRAYALLAVDAIDPRGGWRRAAIDATLRASAGSGDWPNSVFLGYPGLALLLWDFAETRGLGVPVLGG